MSRPRHDRTSTRNAQAAAGGRPGGMHDPDQPGPLVPTVEPSASPLAPGNPGAVTACGHLLYKGKEGKANFCAATRSVPEAAQLLGCSVRTARRWLQRGRLPGRKLGRDWVVDALPLPALAAAPAKPLPPAQLRARSSLRWATRWPPRRCARAWSFSPGGRRAA